ncbi:MAG TPA: DUF6527 family protein [Candidatus Baltobacteraceae bacterium]|nr:DUF6527 family protein [Candidatus Baltobacteraceae bacterium]
MKTPPDNSREQRFTVQFVKSVPETPAPRVLYVSMEFATAVHLCGCGCGNEVVTPLSRRNGWKLLYDGETVSLSPSVGNWSFPCRSHYFITENKVLWAPSIEAQPATARGESQNVRTQAKWRGLFAALGSLIKRK